MRRRLLISINDRVIDGTVRKKKDNTNTGSVNVRRTAGTNTHNTHIYR